MTDEKLKKLIAYIERQQNILSHNNCEFAEGCKFAYGQVKEAIETLGA